MARRSIGIGRPRPKPSGNQVNVGFTRPTTRPVGRPDRPNAIGVRPVGRPIPIGRPPTRPVGTAFKVGFVAGRLSGRKVGQNINPAILKKGLKGRRITTGGVTRVAKGRTISSISRPTRSGGRLTVIKGTGGKQPDRSIIIKTGGKQFDRTKFATGGKQFDRSGGRGQKPIKDFDRTRGGTIKPIKDPDRTRKGINFVDLPDFTRDTGVETSGRSKAFAKLKTKRKGRGRGRIAVPLGLGRRGVLNQRGGAVRKLKKKLGIKRVALKIPKTRSKGKARGRVRGRKVGRNLTPRTPRRIGRPEGSFGSDFNIFRVQDETAITGRSRVQTSRVQAPRKTFVTRRARIPTRRRGLPIRRPRPERRSGSDFDIFRV